ncbi:olfactory receptor 1102-like [Tachyglossus aculeatus]|uniref:olfactory receptor 1102-like n=1 Tax=Tachyglossus aculeatus TaxID=9261 RepID=UPI0018F5ECBB|nr:olfactory receptor 1102-like [Tachyglossus aculeatus]
MFEAQQVEELLSSFSTSHHSYQQGKDAKRTDRVTTDLSSTFVSDTDFSRGGLSALSTKVGPRSGDQSTLLGIDTVDSTVGPRRSGALKSIDGSNSQSPWSRLRHHPVQNSSPRRKDHFGVDWRGPGVKGNLGVGMVPFATSSFVWLLDMVAVNLHNDSTIIEFVLMGFPVPEELQIILFLVFLAIYLFTLVGNLGMVLLIRMDSRLHNPMYYFLSVLSFLDACYSSVVTPKILVNFLAGNKSISFSGCATQILFFVTLGTTECFLLAAMAYDCYVAISNPLLYMAVMSPRIYVSLIIGSYIGGLLHGILHTSATFSLSFCGSNEIRHCFCDIPPLLSLSCSDTHINELLLFNVVRAIEVVTILIVLVSCGYILAAILRIRSAQGRHKAFSTCASHLAGVTIYHSTILAAYVRPISSYTLEHGIMASLFYTVVIPMMNPVIYSLRNKDVKGAFKKVLEKHFQ